MNLRQKLEKVWVEATDEERASLLGVGLDTLLFKENNIFDNMQMALLPHIGKVINMREFLRGGNVEGLNYTTPILQIAYYLDTLEMWKFIERVPHDGSRGRPRTDYKVLRPPKNMRSSDPLI